MNITYSLFKGCSFQLHDVPDSSTALREIANLAAVKQVWPVRATQEHEERPVTQGFDAPNTSPILKRQATNATYSPHVMTQIDKLRAKGITGKGVRVAVIDSGVDYKHPALGGCFGPGCLVAYGHDFIGSGSLGDPKPDPDPWEDCIGHGSHVSGIIAAQPNQYGFTGAAPGVTLGVYRAASCANGLREDMLVAAFNRAFDDGSDVINLSAGIQIGWSSHPVSVAVQRIVEKGVPCIVAMGNNGARGMWTTSAPAAGHGVAAVSNFFNTETPHLHIAASYSVDSASQSISFSWHAGNPTFPTVSLTLWAVSNDTTVPNDACKPLPPGTPDLSRCVVLVRDSIRGAGTCTVSDKINQLVVHGAKYVLVYSTNTL